MNAISAAVLCAGTAILCSCLKKRWPELSLAVAVCTGLCILAAYMPDISGVIKNLNSVFSNPGTDARLLKIMLKACGISLVTEFGVQICRDAGENALAGRIVLCSRLTILGMAAPVISDIFSHLSSLLQLQ